MEKIYCKKCGKLLLEAEYGHFKKICPKCRALNEYHIKKEAAQAVHK